MTTMRRPWFADRAVRERTRHVGNVLTRHGLGALLHQAGPSRFTSAVWRRRHAVELSQPERLRIALGELGATFTKLGQMLSTRADLLPPEYVLELSKLQDAAPEVPVASVIATIERELGASPHELFAFFDEAPLASASIGQVHVAQLHDGTRIVVKIQRPGVAEEIEQDLGILSRIVVWIQEHTEFGIDYDVRALLDEFVHSIHAELDYRREGQNADRLRQAFADDPGVRIPRVYWKYSTHKVLTLERMEGIKISDLAALDRLGVSRRGIAERAVRLFLRQVMEFGFFHADPHPGNFFVQESGVIAMVDFGMVGRVSDELQLQLLRAGLAAIKLDAESLAEELYGLGVAGRRADRRGFERDLDHLVNRYGSSSVSELSAAAVASELTEIVFRHRLQLPSELALLVRVLSMSEGMGLALDPEFHYLEYARPLLKEQWKRRTSFTNRLMQAGRSAADAASLLEALPRRTQRLMGRLERGEMELNVRHERLEAVTREFQQMTNRLAVAMILSASVVALAVALGANHSAAVQRYIDWMFMFGFVFSLGFGVWTLIGILRSGRR